jgi:ribosomal protein S18 acetylase RimI-like enzyme
MPSSPEIRPLHESEVPELSALARAIWRAHYPGIISEAQIEYMLAERYDEAVIREELTRDDVWWDVLVVDGIMAGYTAYLWTDAPGMIKIDKLYFHPRMQRRGYGGLLLDHVAHKMAVHGCKRLTLAVNRNNKTAIAAYLKSGFQIAETSLKQIGGGFWMDDYIMAKNVNG